MNEPGASKSPWEDLDVIAGQLKALMPKSAVIGDLNGLGGDFSNIFRYTYTSGVPKGLGKSHFARSQWTYHCALAMLETSRTMDLLCEFETEGRMDARIVVPATGDSVLFAEWEWSFDSVFKNGGELEKLAARTKDSKLANAFLLSYVEEKNYPSCVARVAQWWGTNALSGDIPPMLYLHLVIYDEKDRFALRSCSIISDLEKPGEVEIVCPVALGFTG